MVSFLGIPYVNRPELLSKALNSVRSMWPWTVLVDNSDTGELVASQNSWPVPILRIPGIAPLSLSQTMNFLQSLAVSRQYPAWFFMHSDAEAGPGVAERLVNRARQALRKKKRWGVIFTHYDTFCSFNTQALSRVGLWDVNLPQYFADNDYYYRLALKKYEKITLELKVIHHEGGSCTMKSDARRTFLNGITFSLYERYYAAKWGGPPHQEKFKQPFDSNLFKPSAGSWRTRVSGAEKVSALAEICTSQNQSDGGSSIASPRW